MYYEEKYDNGVWYWRGTPDGEWIEMGARMLSEKLAAAQRELAAWQKAVDDYNDPRVQHIAAAWWIKNRVAELLAQDGIPAQPQYREPMPYKVLRYGDKVRFI